jgi:hypothetical protein
MPDEFTQFEIHRLQEHLTHPNPDLRQLAIDLVLSRHSEELEEAVKLVERLYNLYENKD